MVERIICLSAPPGNNRYDTDQNIAPTPGQLWCFIGLPQTRAELPHLPIPSAETSERYAVRYGYCYSMLRHRTCNNLYLKGYIFKLVALGHEH